MRRTLYVLGSLLGLFLSVLFVMFLIQLGGWLIGLGVTLTLITLIVFLQWAGRSSPAVGGASATPAWLPGWVVWIGTCGLMLLLIGFWVVRPFVDWGAEEHPQTARARGRAEVVADFRQRLLDDPIASKAFVAAVQHCIGSEDQKGQAAITKLQEAQQARAKTAWTPTADPGATAELEAFLYLTSVAAQGQRCREKIAAIWPEPPTSLTQRAVSTGWWPPSGQGQVYVGLVLLVVSGWLLIKIGDFFWKTFGKFLVGLALIALGFIITVSLGKWAAKEMGLDTVFEGILGGSAPPEMYILVLGLLGLVGLILVPILNNLTRRDTPTGGQNP